MPCLASLSPCHPAHEPQRLTHTMTATTSSSSSKRPIEVIDIEALESDDDRYTFAAIDESYSNTVTSSTAAADSPTHPKSYHDLTAADTQAIITSLVGWYTKHRRKLPWRGDSGVDAAAFGKQQKSDVKRAKQSIAKFFVAPAAVSADEEVKAVEDVQNAPLPPMTPYGTWVSEIMLQQTRVETVIPYWLRWMQQFPTIESLATAPDIEHVNQYWAGLGYYRRAKFLYEGAKYICSELNGQLPQDVKSLMKIPGIGRYTAGAISSIAYQQRAPIVDGNVIRVLCRLRAIDSSYDNKPTNAHVWKLSEQLVNGLTDKQSPGDFNQALMELGATICTPQIAQCSSCPVQQCCMTYREVQTKQRPLQLQNINTNTSADCDMCNDQRVAPPKSVTEYPTKAVSVKPPTDVFLHCCVVRCKRNGEFHYLLVKRTEKGLLERQQEFPCVVVEADTPQSECKQKADAYICNLLDLQSLPVTARTHIGNITHGFSHQIHKMTIETVDMELDVASLAPTASSSNASTQWLAESDLQSAPLTTGVKKVIAAVLNDVTAKKGASKGSASSKPAATKRSKRQPAQTIDEVVDIL